MKIYLLTHAREVAKKTNTGRLALTHCPQVCERIIWDRVNPDPRLLSLPKQSALLYPKSELPCDEGDSSWTGVADDLQAFVIIDATWQESRKIYNRSPYLQALKKYCLAEQPESEFKLRRNQKVGGLCTAEVVVHVLRAKGLDAAAQQLQQDFAEFNSAR